jgi:hypothetical protein
VVTSTPAESPESKDAGARQANPNASAHGQESGHLPMTDEVPRAAGPAGQDTPYVGPRTSHNPGNPNGYLTYDQYPPSVLN